MPNAWEQREDVVPVRTLRPGDVFADINGAQWQVDHGAHNGVVHVREWGGDRPNVFAGCALVRPIMSKKYVTPEE